MKKSLIALAVTGAMVAPMVAQADATLYGSFRVGIAKTDNNGAPGSKTDGDLDLIDTSSRMGIKGDVDLGLEGTKGLFHWEAQVRGLDDGEGTDAEDASLTNRLLYVGMQGDWGKLLIGRQYHPHYLLINAPTNVFHPGSGGYGERFNLGNTFHKRQEGTIAYYTPNMNGFQVIGGVVLLGDSNDNDGSLDDDVDGYNIAATYSAGAFTVSASYGDVETADSPESGKETTGVAAKYKANGLEVMAKYEAAETTAGGVETQDEEVFELASRYTLDNGVAVYGRFADYEDDARNFDYDQFGLGVSKKMGKGIVYLEHVNNDSDDSTGDRTVAGYRLDF